MAEALNRVYELLRLYVNFFQPVIKLVAKTRHWAKGHKVYDTARTPYQRLLEAGVLTEAKRQELTAMYYGLNPVSLLKQISENLECLWKLAEHPVHHEGIIPRPQTDLLSSALATGGGKRLCSLAAIIDSIFPFSSLLASPIIR